MCLLYMNRIIRNIYQNVISGLTLGSENTVDHFILVCVFHIFYIFFNECVLLPLSYKNF